MSESDPLLPVSEPEGGDHTTQSSGSSVLDSTAPLKPTRWLRFYVFIVCGVAFIFLFNLVFWPRTSLSRDLRRLHNQPLPFYEVERLFFQSLEENNAREIVQFYTNEAHLAGTNDHYVQWTRQQFQKYGLKTELEKYDVFLNTPLNMSLKLLDGDGNIVYQPTLKEDILSEDKTTGSVDAIPAFHGYSANGNVTANFIFANYGRKEDFEALEANGVDLQGKIAIVRYGNILRGLKVKFAEDHGCVGVLMYSDPGDDNVRIDKEKGIKAYPEGPARNPSSIQRGSVQLWSETPGDPTTPGWASKKHSKRVEPITIPKIPSLPMSYREALPILKTLNFQKSIDLGWKGGLDEFSYHVGPSTTPLNLYNLQEYKIVPNVDVIGRINGIVDDEYIVIGNHRDSWIVGGAGDPNSGSAVILEIARALHDLQLKGWKPIRTIIFASWDGEEYAMLGSTEWGEDNAKDLKTKCVAYLNLDVGVSGTHFGVSSSPLMNTLAKSIAKKIPHPVNGSIYDHWEEESGAIIKTLGSGTDYSVFQNHLGIPSIDMGFRDRNNDPVYHYHSNYDSFHWMDEFADPGFKYHSAVAKYLGLLALTLSDNEIISFEVSDYAYGIKQYVDHVYKDIPDSWNKTDFDLSLNNLKESIYGFIDAANGYDQYTKDLKEQLTIDYPWFKSLKKLSLLFRIKIANFKLSAFDRIFLHDDGLDNGREWFKHVIYGPHRYLGYAGDILPGLHDAIVDGKYDRAIDWVSIIQDKVDKAKRVLNWI